MLAIYPFEPRPNHVELTRTRQTADVVEAAVAVPIPNERAAGPLAHAARRLAALDATPVLPITCSVAAGAPLTLVPQAII